MVGFILASSSPNRKALFAQVGVLLVPLLAELFRREVVCWGGFAEGSVRLVGS